MKKFVELYFVCPVTAAEDFLEHLFCPKLSPVVAKALIAGLIKGLANPSRVEKMLPTRWAVFSICVLVILRSAPFLSLAVFFFHSVDLRTV